MPSVDVSDVVFPDRDLPLHPGEPAFNFRHRTVSGVSAGADNVDFPFYWTRLDHPGLNGRPNAILTVTPVGRIEIDEKTRSATMIRNASPVGIVYRAGGVDRWYIVNLDLAPMAVRADFHVAVSRGD